MHIPVSPADVRRIELLRVMPSPEGDVVPIGPLGSVAGPDAVAIAQLVADLPDDEMMRCFNPVYALELHGAAGLLAEIAFCFRCHNARIALPGQDRAELIGFDPGSAAGQELLARFKAADRPPNRNTEDTPGR
ncbi:hypothetical protein [Amycolatopsis vancoresmycina]|uniref:Uncharacterized protein n=1 Tax=Amycolatopsis vancoresmycina DSM 44592 TaxID=1292037 RepID=R1I1E6_9PSEU|nr:hypothetical protein [Amycolatopsis vancoresmycina]EOD69635.1 hypothetical protein H480_05210 [Amycolatopsis vancoresmycina DSM 44592]